MAEQTPEPNLRAVESYHLGYSIGWKAGKVMAAPIVFAVKHKEFTVITASCVVALGLLRRKLGA